MAKLRHLQAVHLAIKRSSEAAHIAVMRAEADVLEEAARSKRAGLAAMAIESGVSSVECDIDSDEVPGSFSGMSSDDMVSSNEDDMKEV